MGLIITCLIYIPTITLIILRINTQSMKNRSPFLGLICLFFSFLILLGNFYLLFLNPNKNNQNTFACKWMSFDLSTLHYLLSFSLVFRSLRLDLIYTHNNKLNFNKKQMREKFYLKVIFYYFLFLFFLGINWS